MRAKLSFSQKVFLIFNTPTDRFMGSNSSWDLIVPVAPGPGVTVNRALSTINQREN